MNNIRLLSTIALAAFIAAGCNEDNTPGTVFSEGNSITLPQDGGTYEILYTGTPIVDGVSGDSWIHDIDTDTEGTVTFAFDANGTGSDRETVIQFSTAAGNSLTVEVNQSATSDNPLYSCNIPYSDDYSVKFKLSARDEGSRCFYGITEADRYPQFSTDQYFIDAEIERIRKQQGDDAVASHFFTDSLSTTVNGLSSDTEYIIYCTSLDDDYRLTGELATFPFSTKEPVQFNLSVSINGPIAIFTTNPNHAERKYFIAPFTVNECSEYDSVEEAVISILDYELGHNAWNMGYSLADYVDLISTCSAQKVYSECAVDIEYYGACFGIAVDEAGTSIVSTSEMEIVRFVPEPVEPSDNVITIEITGITQTSCDYKVTVTEEDDPYLFFIDTVANWENYDDDELMEYIAPLFSINSYGRFGETTGTLPNMTPGTEYMAFAFGAAGGRPTTELTKVVFTTLD